MAKTKTKKPDNKRAAAPANGAKKNGASTTAPEKAARTRKPPIDLACKLGALIVKKATALSKNVRRWTGDVTKEQRGLVLRLQSELAKLNPMAESVGAVLAAVKDSGYDPKAGGGRAPAMPDGARVIIKDEHYDAAIHGEVNDYVYVGKTEKFLLIRAFDEPKGKLLPVRRSWIKHNEAAEALDAANAGTEPDDAAPEVEDDTDAPEAEAAEG
jgi:hypothetical protein